MIKENRNTGKDVVQQSKPKTLPKVELSEGQLDAIAGGIGAPRP